VPGLPGLRRAPAAALLVLLAASPARALDPALTVTQYSIDAWTIDDGLPQNTVNAVLQTRDRYLWLGTYDGLARFDGIRFQVFNTSNTPAIRSNGIRGLWEDRAGTLWIGTNGGGLVRFKDGAFTAVEGELKDALVWAIREDRQGDIWVGTSGAGLHRLTGGRAVREEIGPGADAIYAIQEDLSGALWVGTHGGGLKRRDVTGTWSTITVTEGLPASLVSALAVDGDGRLWVGTVGGGVAVVERGRVSRVYGPGQGLGADIVWALNVDRDGSVWVGTAGGGLSRIRGDQVQTLTQEKGLPESVVYALHEDREGTLWVGTNGGGLAQMRAGTFASYGIREGLPHDFVYAVMEGRSGLWAATVGGLARWDGSQFRPEPIPGLDGSAAIRALSEDAAGNLWVATYGRGVARRAAGKWTLFGRKDGLGSDSVRAVLAARDGTVWAGTIDGLSSYSAGRWTTRRVGDGLPHNSLIALHEDDEGAIWVGSDGGGLTRVRGGELTVFRKQDGLASDLVLAFARASGGGLWIGTNGGLSLFREGGFTSWTARSGLPTDAVAQIVEDGRGSLWLGTSRGVSQVTLSSMAEQARGARTTVESVTFGSGDGMRSAQCSAPAHPGAIRTRDGRLWFSTVRGLAAHQPGRVLRDREPPPVVIERVVVDGRDVDVADEIVLPAGTARLEIQYTGLCLLAPRRVQFRTRLEGLEEEWADAGTRRVAYYSALGPGTYRFQVRAANGDGVWNDEGAQVGVRQQPRFFQTAWFYVAASLAAVGLVAMGYRARVASLRARERDLKQLVEERTRGLQEAKENAEQASRVADEQRLIAEKADHLKTELLGIAAHDLKNPLQTILGYSEAIVLDGEPRTTEMAGAIERSSRKMLRLIDDLLTTAAVDGGSMELRRDAVDLARLARAYVDEVRPQAAKKRQTIVVEVDGPAVVGGDESRLRQVLQNLVGNALKFSGPDTEVAVRVRSDGQEARLEVSDQGPGLQAEDRARLFTRFARLSARPTGNEGSTGLGLSIVKRLVELHGGRVWAADRAGRGATFVVELPLVDAEPARRAPGATSKGDAT
jgi:signal transduction histidine kinase/ligand-binding sensor domain-containing protein